MRKSHQVLGKQSVVTHITRWLVGLRNFGPLHCLKGCSHVAEGTERDAEQKQEEAGEVMTSPVGFY